MKNALQITEPRWRYGFTMSELLVAITLSMIVAVATFRALSVHSTNTRYAVEVAEVWERLHLSAELIRETALGAATSGTPYSAVHDDVCPKPPTNVYRGLVIDDGETTMADDLSLDAAYFGDNVNIDPDQCIFQSPVDPTPYQPNGISGDEIDFTGSGVPDANEAQFETFFTGHSLVIENDEGRRQIVDVTDVDYDDRIVTVDPPPTQQVDPNPCGYIGTGNGEDITVITNVRYRIIQDPNDDDGSLLIRENLEPDLSTPAAVEVIDGTRLIIAENIVDLQCWVDGLPTGIASFRTDGRITGSYFGDDNGTLTAAQVGPSSTDVQRGRIFHFQITGRTRREFEILTFTDRDTVLNDGLDLMKRWEIDPDVDGSALAQTLAGQVELENFIIEALQ